MDEILQLQSFEQLYINLTVDGDSQRNMTVAFLRDVSSMLSMVSAVREGNFERHLQAERDMLRLVFAFDHQQSHVVCCSLQFTAHRILITRHYVWFILENTGCVA